MSMTLDIDPALRKLLDELPEGDPDRPMAVVWVEHCPARHTIPLNVPTRCNFGPWFGPPIPMREVVVHAQVGAHHGSSQLGESDVIVLMGVAMIGTVTVEIH